MIKLLDGGHYLLTETKGHTKILVLNGNQTYAWINAADIGEILVTSHKRQKMDNILAIGKYRLYEIKNEPKLTDLLHLELYVGDGLWQGYLLPTGIPTTKQIKKRIIPTFEVITKSITHKF